MERFSSCKTIAVCFVEVFFVDLFAQGFFFWLESVGSLFFIESNERTDYLHRVFLKMALQIFQHSLKNLHRKKISLVPRHLYP